MALTYYWKLVFELGAVIPNELKNRIMESFGTVLSDLYYTKVIDKYIGMAIRGIADRNHIEDYFKIIH